MKLGFAFWAFATVPLLPVLLLQGRRVRQSTPQLPAAAGPDQGSAGDGEPLKLLVLGESTVAGIGAASHHEGLAGRLGAALAAASGRAVHWRAVGESGVTAHQTVALLDRLGDAQFDAAVIALGVNDTKKLRSVSRFTKDIAALVAALRERAGPVPVALSSVPPMARFPSLPWPLRSIMGTRSAALDEGLQRLAARLENVRHVSVNVPEGDHWFCSDRFHPSPEGYAFWGMALGQVLAADARFTRRAATPS